MVLKTRALTKYYGDFLALDKADLDLKEGEVVGFLGPNGAGKTTTIRILLGLLRKSEGEAYLFGMDTWADSVKIHERIAYVPGDVNLWPNLTGGEVLDLFSKLRGGLDRKKREELLERFEFDPTKKCSTYSKGNRQKVALISAFASHADVYILDEPTSGLDPLMSLVFQQCVEEVKKKGKSVFMSSHILADVEKLCDRISIIRKGKIVETGTLGAMRQKSYTQVTVETTQPIRGLETWVTDLVLTNKGLQGEFRVESRELDRVIKHLGTFTISSLTCRPPTLEELFMRHYGEEVGDRRGA